MKLFVTRAYIGVESLDDKTLRMMNKGITAKKMIKELEASIRAGISIHCHFIFGTDFDTPESVEKTVKSAKEMGVYGVSLFCSTPFPGTLLRKEMIAQKRIITSDWSRYNLQHIVTAPLMEKPSEFQIAIEEGYRDFYSFSDAIKNMGKGVAAGIYSLMIWAAFKKRDKDMREYIEFLKEWERKKYKNKIFIGL